MREERGAGGEQANIHAVSPSVLAVRITDGWVLFWFGLMLIRPDLIGANSRPDTQRPYLHILIKIKMNITSLTFPM